MTPPLSNRRHLVGLLPLLQLRFLGEENGGSSLRLAVAVHRTNPASPASALSFQAASEPSLLLPISCSLQKPSDSCFAASRRDPPHICSPRDPRLDDVSLWMLYHILERALAVNKR
ncbi:hypothetical protein EJB05_03265, partial [Eragrostis curvula]